MSKKIYSMITDQIIENLNKGISWHQGWFSHLNPITKTEYQGVNKLLLGLDCIAFNYNNPIWLTWNQVKKEGLRVKKGSKSSLVVYFTTKEIIIEDKDKSNDKPTVKTIPVIRYYRVFNLNCIEGETHKIEKLINKHQASLSATAKETIKRLESLISLMGYKMQRSYNASCNYKTKTINIPSVFKSESEHLLTIAHEIIHATAPFTERKPKIEDLSSYSFEELVAEIGACFLASKLGYKLQNVTNSAAYIKGWTKYLKENPKNTIYKAASQAEKAINFLIQLEKNTIKKAA